MSATIRSRGLCSFISKNNRLFCSKVSSSPPKPPPSPASVAAADQSPANQPIISSAALVDGQNPPPIPPPAPPAAKKSWNFLKFGLIGALTVGVATAGYASYAYTLDEVDEKTKAFEHLLRIAWRMMHLLLIQTKDSRLSPLRHGSSGKGMGKGLCEKFKALAYTSAVTGGSPTLVYNHIDNEYQSFNGFSSDISVPAKAIDLYLDMRRLIEEQVHGFTEPLSDKLLPDLHPMEQHVFTLVLDLNETLIYSDWKRDRGWRTFKRPGVDAFLEHLAQFYEIVVYSDQLSMYVDPVLRDWIRSSVYDIGYQGLRLDIRMENITDFCWQDLSKLNRDPAKILYVSGHALETSLQPENCVQIKPWKLEEDDTQLLDLIPFLEYVARNRPADIRPVLASYQGHDIAKEFIERSKEYQR
ncbi:Mitochondrial import inner membrane translocase subunit TIM50 [Vitis vinifera]|uniref:Mitochondrial import inner membrane translocase subunit TIM50 n=1 Tax=Vitis vinifera TaxID=29760 RepID=A0A438K108_VITVI|nr:Mitochondrial import inner membrane translocase subunit TIM50 [Vitis vinifera]